MELFKNSKGFCLHHFKDLVEVGEMKLNDKQKSEFYPVLFDLMEKNMKRVEEEVTWFCDKQDYLNRENPGEIPKTAYSALCRSWQGDIRQILYLKLSTDNKRAKEVFSHARLLSIIT